MLRELKLATLRLLKSGGIFDLVANSRWRQQRLLILCYHGISLEDEHLWRPGLYMEPAILEQRLEILKRGNYAVLPLGEALERLRAGTLPPRSVVITFDDGAYDFYKQAFPRLKSYGYPVTVYQTTYYTDFQRPVFNLIASYMLWKRRGETIRDGQDIGLPGPMDLRTEASRHAIVMGLLARANQEGMSGVQKDELCAGLAKLLGLDYEALVSTRMLQLMNAQEVREVASSGVDIQLHTHRHRTPQNESKFRKELQDNRARILELASKAPSHFCYPSGVYRRTFFPWLTDEHVVSATTCDSGLVTRASEMLLIPRFVDSQKKTATDFESWLSGVGDLLAVRRMAAQNYVPVET